MRRLGDGEVSADGGEGGEQMGNVRMSLQEDGMLLWLGAEMRRSEMGA